MEQAYLSDRNTDKIKFQKVLGWNCLVQWKLKICSLIHNVNLEEIRHLLRLMGFFWYNKFNHFSFWLNSEQPELGSFF